MYLSRVEVDIKNRSKIRELNHLGAYHHWVEQSFPEELSQNERSRKLWRLDELQGKKYLLVVSETKPDFKKLEKYGVADSAESRSYDAFLDRLQNGQIVRFRATLNPVISISTGKQSGKRGRVMPHVTTKQQESFLLQRAEKNGFSLEEDEIYITKSSYAALKKENGKPIHISTVTYEGRLTITDRSRFTQVLVQGLGKKKAYGCGLITVIPEK